MIPGCVEHCPGCRYRSLSPEESDRRKTDWAASCLNGLAAPERLRAPNQRWGYRRKALLHARPSSDSWNFGLLRRSRKNPREMELVPIPDCPLHMPLLNERLRDLRILIPLKAPLVFVSLTGSILTLVLKTAPNDRDRAWMRELEKTLRANGTESLQVNWNPAAGRRALSSRHQEVIFGSALETDGIFFHGAQSFRQQIEELEEASLSSAEEFLADSNVNHVVDLYSGIGVSLARWSKRGWKTVGVELVGDACEAASLNAPRAGILKGKVENRLPQLDEFIDSNEFVVYTNPPRDGHSKEVLEWILTKRPLRLAYLSCNPKSLARDLSELAESYSIQRVQPFDFFPQTDHVECLALCARRGEARRPSSPDKKVFDRANGL